MEIYFGQVVFKLCCSKLDLFHEASLLQAPKLSCCNFLTFLLWAVLIKLVVRSSFCRRFLLLLLLSCFCCFAPFAVGKAVPKDVVFLCCLRLSEGKLQVAPPESKAMLSTSSSEAASCRVPCLSSSKLSLLILKATPPASAQTRLLRPSFHVEKVAVLIKLGFRTCYVDKMDLVVVAASYAKLVVDKGVHAKRNMHNISNHKAHCQSSIVHL